MNRIFVAVAFALLVAPASTVSAQLLVAKDGPIVYGHHHLNATSVEASTKFFADTIGGVAIKVGTDNRDVIKFPNVLLFMRPNMPPSGGTKGTTVNHIGFSVPNLRRVVDQIKANGYRMVTAGEAPPNLTVKDDIAVVTDPGPVSAIAYAMAPDDVKVEFVELKAQRLPIMLHHVHFFGQKNLEMQAWYVKVFGAKERNGGTFPAADLPGVALNFSPSTTPVVATAGRALDHIGFEVKNLEAFTKKLEADGIKLTVPYRQVPALGIAIAFVNDPWGTNIELTEGLDKIK
jgi:catechol 2,3-dioxygenase-like lactoylglutathione lyase family enzyme